MAHFGLADTMNSSKALFQTIWIPWQVIVYHQMRTLEVDAFACGIGRDEYSNVDVLHKERFNFSAIIAEHATMYINNCFIVSQ